PAKWNTFCRAALFHKHQENERRTSISYLFLGKNSRAYDQTEAIYCIVSMISFVPYAASPPAAASSATPVSIAGRSRRTKPVTAKYVPGKSGTMLPAIARAPHQRNLQLPAAETSST